MIVEVLNAWCLLLAGALVMGAAGLRGWGVIPLGFLSGVCLEVGFGFLQALTGISGSPILTWGLMLATAAGAWVVRRRSSGAPGVPWIAVAGVGGAAVAGVALFRWLRVYTWHIDSLEYVQQAELLVRGRFVSTADAYMLDKRLIAFPLLEAPAQLSGADVLYSVVPLLALATLGAFAWFIRVGVTPGLSRRAAAAVVAVAVIALATVNRYVANAFYVNGHLLTGALLLLAAGSCWLLLDGPSRLARPMLVTLALSAPALSLTRPEGIFLAALVVAPFVVSQRVPMRSRRVVAVSVGAIAALWYGLVSVMGFVRGEDGPQGLAVACAGGALVLLGLALPFIRPRGLVGTLLSRVPRVFDWGLWLGVVVAFALAPRLMADSVTSIQLNAVAYDGVWGLSFDALAIVVLLALAIGRGAVLSPLRAVVTGFIPIALILAFVRGSAYRVAVVDSLNRMLIEVVPVAILLVVAVAAGRRVDRTGTTGARAPRAAAQSERR